MSRKGQARLNMYIPKELHDKLKEISAKRNETITKLILREIFLLLLKEKNYE